MADPELVFVYGSLMRGFDLHHLMKAGELLGAGAVDGTLVSLGRYPALVDAPGRVRGEVYRFDDLAAALDVLDDVEEFDPADPENSVYVRAARQVALDGGSDVIAWVYVYHRDAAGLPRVSGGDWRAHAD
jgi:gamma-glutamylcyclotransferase (GGCT)/AIG2-like uncharacterized protein YtfP